MSALATASPLPWLSRMVFIAIGIIVIGTGISRRMMATTEDDFAAWQLHLVAGAWLIALGVA